MLHSAVQSDLARLRSLPETEYIHAALIEALASEEVSKELEPILEKGAIYTQTTLCPAGCMEGMVLFTLETEWAPGFSYNSPPDRVSVLVETMPPKVLKVERHGGEGEPSSGPFCFPEGLVPVTIRGMSPPKFDEVIQFLEDSNRSTEAWLKKEKLDIGIADPKAATGIRNPDSTNSKCTSLLCAEKSGEDDDWSD